MDKDTPKTAPVPKKGANAKAARVIDDNQVLNKRLANDDYDPSEKPRQRYQEYEEMSDASSKQRDPSAEAVESEPAYTSPPKLKPEQIIDEEVITAPHPPGNSAVPPSPLSWYKDWIGSSKNDANKAFKIRISALVFLAFIFSVLMVFAAKWLVGWVIPAPKPLSKDNNNIELQVQQQSFNTIANAKRQAQAEYAQAAPTVENVIVATQAPLEIKPMTHRNPAPEAVTVQQTPTPVPAQTNTLARPKLSNPSINLATTTLKNSQQQLETTLKIVLQTYPQYFRLSQQIQLLQKSYTPIFIKINAGELPAPIIYESFLQHLQQVANVCLSISNTQKQSYPAQKAALSTLAQSLQSFRQATKQLNHYDPTLRLANPPQAEADQLQRVLVTNLTEQIEILSDFYSLAQQLAQALQVYAEHEQKLLALLQNYSEVLNVSYKTLVLQYKANVINESTEMVYQLYQQLENIAKRQRQIRRQYKKIQQNFLSQ